MSRPTVSDIEEQMNALVVEDGDSSDYPWADEDGFSSIAVYQKWEEKYPDDPEPPSGPYINKGQVRSGGGYGGYGSAKYRDATPEELAADKARSDWLDRFYKFYHDIPDDQNFITIPAGRVFHVKHHGGEGEGDQYWSVLKLVSDDGTERFFKISGWYASHDGGYYDGPMEEVKPTKKEITVYV